MAKLRSPFLLRQLPVTAEQERAIWRDVTPNKLCAHWVMESFQKHLTAPTHWDANRAAASLLQRWMRAGLIYYDSGCGWMLTRAGRAGPVLPA